MSDDRNKVLLVDDDVDFLEANRVALEAAGFEVLTESDSTTGVETAEREQPNLIIMDLMMEKPYSGFHAVQALAAHEHTRGIPVIMVSAVTTDTGFRIDDTGSKPEWLKVLEFLNKPVDPIELAKKAKELTK
ncbi:MAG: response regulator [Armatimonadota bacterium]